MQNLQGYLLIAHPTRSVGNFRHSVQLVFRHDSHGLLAFQINRALDQDYSISTVMHGMGIVSNEGMDDSLYRGGSHGQNRVNVVHSLDWQTAATVRLNSEVGISSDVSVLVAISKNQGPENYRAVAGFEKWTASEIRQQLGGDDDQQWIIAPAQSELIFDYSEQEQWSRSIEASAKHMISSWF